MSTPDRDFGKQIVQVEGRILGDGKVASTAELECGHKLTSDRPPDSTNLSLGLQVHCKECMLATGDETRPAWAVSYDTVVSGSWEPHFRWKDAAGRTFVEVEEAP